MILFIKGHGKSVMARRVANLLGDSFVTIEADDALRYRRYSLGAALADSPDTVVVEGDGCRDGFMLWLAGCSQYEKLTLHRKYMSPIHIPTPNFIVCVEGRSDMTGVDVVDLGPTFEAKPVDVTRDRHMRAYSRDHAKMPEVKWSDLPGKQALKSAIEQAHVEGRGAVMVHEVDGDIRAYHLRGPVRDLVIAANAVLKDVEGLLRDQRVDPDDGSVKYDGQSAHELQAAIALIKGVSHG